MAISPETSPQPIRDLHLPRNSAGTAPLADPPLVTQAETEVFSGRQDPLAKTFQDVYLYKRSAPDTATPMADVRVQTEKANAKDAKSLGKRLSPDLQARLKSLSSNPGEALSALEQIRSQVTDPKALQLLGKMIDRQGDLKALADVPYQSADGIMRDRNYYVAPATLNAMAKDRGWEQAPDGSPIADAVVVGAGPGGLATSYNLAQRGARVVTFEGGYVAQAFSNAGAQPVHVHRTNRLLTSLVRTGYALQDLSTPMGLPGSLGHIVGYCARARDMWGEKTGQPITGLAENIRDPKDWQQPATRGELFEHFQEVGDYVGERCPNSFLVEQAPVSQVKRENGLFCVETSKGHKVYARKLVMSTGLVTPNGANAKILPQFQKLADANPGQYLTVREDADLATKDNELDKVLKGESKQQIIMSDRLLGTPDMQLALQKLPAGSHVAMVGSGESALKGALEVLSQNPNLNVDFFTKAAVEPAQVQVPSENFSPVVLEHGPDHADYGTFSNERYKKSFDTPVTPRSMIQMLDAEQAGHLRVFELGAFFDENSMDVAPDGNGGTKITVKDPKVLETLKKQHEEFQRYGIKSDEVTPDLGSVQMIINAAGYDHKALQMTPLAQQLQQQGLMSLSTDPSQGTVGEPRFNGLVSYDCPDLAFDTAGALNVASDAAIPGMAVRGRKLAETLLADLPARPLPPQPEVAKKLGADWVNDYDDRQFEGFVDHRGVAPNAAEQLQTRARTGNADQKAQAEHALTFPEPESFLRGLDDRDPATLTPSEHLTLDRGKALIERIGEPDYHVANPG